MAVESIPVAVVVVLSLADDAASASAASAASVTLASACPRARNASTGITLNAHA
jgi:hypothetical protein